jgi:hypothetical protein
MQRMPPVSLYELNAALSIDCSQPKPQHSYIGLIAMAILSAPGRRMLLSDVYQWILSNYPYFRGRGPGWRNSIRHNLSLNGMCVLLVSPDSCSFSVKIVS